MTGPSAPHAVPGIGWLLGCSLWLVPVLLGFGMTSWIGFAVIGILIVRLRWVLVAALQLWLLSRLDVGPDGIALMLQRIQYGYLDPALDGPLLALYLAGIAYAVHANRVWLRILWGRRERGERMLGWRPPPRPSSRPATAQDADGAPSVGGDDQHSGNGPEARAARARLEARAARGFRAVLERERTRVHGAVLARQQQAATAPEPVVPRALPEAGPVPVPVLFAHTPLTPTPLTAPLTSAPLHSAPLPSTTSLGLPRGPLDPRVASADELAAIPSIGPERAALLVEARSARPLASVEDVVEVLGLAAHEVLRARPYLRF